ncbi:MAG: 3' terminal RNA ribose 2'-O-methyltransferase Hen1 [Candidatus Wallbacteria bacterium HGW-Wallbacteria-1]|uniref:Small RNA 2'-O-methyltransferase n=1 Tax=Candidatus Wallbacteria bacterium HGW-Wallbacteria-1 TaxID=2013854 RepID=A0A2N1PLQ2_9BACT|nr:MAG: 3' terminal RNA ribose 2'-O-methyltransferase Hen1 [Candidatus Wallbacteria bacterium HGW-Wallbacteria-1]
MIFTISTSTQPTETLSYLLHKHPAKYQLFNLSFGNVHVFYLENSDQICTAAMVLDIDTVDMVRSRHLMKGDAPLYQYINDRPYVASSFLSVAIAQVYGSALKGSCKDRPEAAETKLALTARLSVLPCRSGELLLRRLFNPLGYEINLHRHQLNSQFSDWGQSSYYTVELKKECTLSELLTHLYVLVPVLDNQKHYYISNDEVDKLINKGEGWLQEHPERELIVKRYLKFSPSLANSALARLVEVDEPQNQPEVENASTEPEETIEKELSLNEERMGTVLSVLKSLDATTVIDLGCGEGKLLRSLYKDRTFTKVVGADVSIRALEIAAERLRLNEMPLNQKDRLKIFQGSLLYKDNRFEGFEAATIIEVIEHLDEPRLEAFEKVVFGHARPRHVILTTPNREYNVVWSNLGRNLRHNDHRFEWTRDEFRIWCEKIGRAFGYSQRYLGIGPENPNIGHPTQMCIFSRGMEGVQI